MASKTITEPSKSTEPLSGLRVLVGRARHQAGVLSDDLRNLGAEVIEIPFIEIRKPRSYKPLDIALQNIGNYDWLILTSVNGVDALWQRMEKLQLSALDLKYLKIAAIGPATRKAIEAHGLSVEVVPKKYIAESVVESLRELIPGKRVLLARAKVARDVIPEQLRKLGAHLDVAEAYETVAPTTSRTRLRAAMRNARRRPDVIAFTSSSSVKNFVALLAMTPEHGNTRIQIDSRIKLASIGPVTSSTLREFDLPVNIEAREYTIPGLVQAIVAHRDGHS